MLTFLFTIFKAGPEFERIAVRRVAQLNRGLSDASQFYAAGRDYEEKGKQASAVLHFQKAAALDPTQLYYQRALGSSYAKLGYYQRSLNVLESALDVAAETDLKQDLEQLLTQVQIAKAASETTGS
jgi:tetratricopeptide (TPR) repeat protein